MDGFRYYTSDRMVAQPGGHLKLIRLVILAKSGPDAAAMFNEIQGTAWKAYGGGHAG